MSKNENFQETSFSLSTNSYTVIKELSLSKYKLNNTKKFVNLLEATAKFKENDEANSTVPVKEEKPVTHILSKFSIFTLDSQINFDNQQIPSEFYHDLMYALMLITVINKHFCKIFNFNRIIGKNEYLPVAHINKLIIKDEDYNVLNKDTNQVNLTIEHVPVSVGKLRLFKQFESSLDSMREMGFNEKQFDELISLFTDTNVYLILLTFFVSFLHVILFLYSLISSLNFY